MALEGSLSLNVTDTNASYLPYDTISGKFSWRDLFSAKSIELSLFWFTKGKGTEDVEIVENLIIEQPAPEGQKEFSFKLPIAPYSFSGKLISLIWALELVAESGEAAERFEFTMSPTGKEIVLNPA